MTTHADSVDGAPQRLQVADLMVVLGDSIAVGIGAGQVSDGCMAQVAAVLCDRHPGLSMVNLAFPSEGTASMIAPGGQLERAEAAIAQALEQGLRVGPITLSMGANDSIEAATLGEDSAFAAYRANLATVFERLDAAVRPQGSAVGDVLAAQTFYNPFTVCEVEPGLPSPDQLAPRRARHHDFNTVLHAVAAEHGVIVVDVAAAFEGRELSLTWLRTGDIHPNPDGQQVIRDAFLAVIGQP